MIMKAEVSSKAHPEYGQATISFPIPDSEYDHIIGMLENMSIGSATVQDCWVLELDSPYPILNRLVSQYVCQRQSEIVRKRRRNFVVFRRQEGGGTKSSVSLVE